MATRDGLWHECFPGGLGQAAGALSPGAPLTKLVSGTTQSRRGGDPGELFGGHLSCLSSQRVVYEEGERQGKNCNPFASIRRRGTPVSPNATRHPCLSAALCSAGRHRRQPVRRDSQPWAAPGALSRPAKDAVAGASHRGGHQPGSHPSDAATDIAGTLAPTQASFVSFCTGATALGSMMSGQNFPAESFIDSRRHMSKTTRSGGINTQAGITAQNWAALSMFVQQTFDPSFVKIQLEQAKLADFVLVFQNRRIICESKNYHISYADIKSILDTISGVGPDDTIVIICKSIEEEARDRLAHAQHFSKARDWLKEEKEYTDQHLALLSKLSFWQVDQSLNEKIVKNLMEQRFNIWLSNSDLIYATLIEKIFKQSARGGEYTKDEFITDVETYRKQLAENDDSSLKTKPLEERVKEVLTAIPNPTSRLASSSNPLQVLVTDPNLHGAAFNVLKNMDQINLRDWDLFWKATYSTYFSMELFSVLKTKATTVENDEYAINFVQGHADSLRYKIYDEYQYKEAADLLEAARKFAPGHDVAIADLLIKFYRDAKQNVLFIERMNNSSEWILIELARSLAVLYGNSDHTVREKIMTFIDAEFNL